tara:strand:- start:2614 stop:3228 length:615 start_codon:yes stop_codon:yes gene_type:complete
MNKGDLSIKNERDKIFHQIVKNENLCIKNEEILDFGCGEGFVLNLFNNWGVKSNLLIGVDISKKRIDLAKSKFPQLRFIKISKDLPFENNKFSLIIISTVFSSIINEKYRAYWASELDRVLKPNGSILFYDMKINNPFNRKTKKVTMSELATLFKGYEIKINSLTVWPHLARFLSIISRRFYPLLTKIKLLHTHFVAVLIKKNI